MQVGIFNVGVGGVYSNHSDLKAECVNMPVSEQLSSGNTSVVVVAFPSTAWANNIILK
jgi:hypothetical protein